MTQLTDHLNFLFKDGSGYVYAPIKKKDGTWIQKFFNYPLERSALVNWITAESLESDTYLSPVFFKEKKVSKEAVASSNVVWVEVDGQHKIDWKDIPKPNLIVQTSNINHIHCYWRIPPTPIEAVEELNRRLTYFLEADSSGWDITQVLRPPDTVNYKHNLPVHLVNYDPLVIHDLAVFDTAPPISKAPESFKYESLLEVKEVIRDNKLDPYLQNRILSELVLHPFRSEFLMRTGYLLAEAELDPLEIVSCLYHIDSRIKKFVGREDQLKRLGEIASIACFKIEKELYIGVYSPQDILTHTLELEWIIPGLLHSTGQLIVTGAPGVGKTQFCFDLAYHLATGTQILDRVLSRAFKVAFLSLEMDVTELKYIFKAHAVEFKDEKWNQNLHVISPDIDFVLNSFEKIIKELKPDVVFIDSISELATEDLKESEARAIMRWLKKLRKTHNLALILVHHNRKASDSNKKPKSLSDLYGSFIFAKVTETVLGLWQEDGRELMELDTLKARFGKKQSFRLKRTENLTFIMEANFNVSITGPDTSSAKVLGLI